MANILRILIPLISSITFFILISKTVSQSTDFFFNTFTSNTTNLTYQGDAHVPSGSSFLRLTKTDADGFPQQVSVGRVLYSKPVQFRARDSIIHFKTTLKFTIKPTHGYAPGDGLAFFIAPVGSLIPGGSSGGELGIFDYTGISSALFAVEFDLFANDWDPVEPRHIGVDINSIKSRKVVGFGSSCLGHEVQLSISYNGYMLNVVLTCREETRLLDYECDLRKILPQQVQVGISASTGSFFALHDIHFWRFNSFVENRTHHASNASKLV
ncbi:hypothetical protein C2S51_031573 [Perilla frutescens var. frutescens]|nr:hypothetical protein C2S51_031573 [Perilla frutescens var. frutescens]